MFLISVMGDCEDMFGEENTGESAFEYSTFQDYHILWNIFKQSSIFKDYQLSGDTKH